MSADSGLLYATMESALQRIEYESEPGSNTDKDVRVYALSTCAFCRRGMEYLKKNGIAFKYVYLDKIDQDLKKQAKAELKEKFRNITVFPVLVVDDAEAVAGFVEEEWKDMVEA